METLTFLRSKALNNIPPDKIYTEMTSVINKCEECSTKKINVSNTVDGLCKRCAMATILFNRYSESNIPLEYWHFKMEKDFIGDKRLLDKYNDLINRLKQVFENGTSICFSGQHGVGKSSIVTCLLKKAVQKGYSTLYSTFDDIITTLTQAPNEEKFLAKKELSMIAFLAIDEIDSRFISSENMADLYARQLEHILRTRRQNKLPTFLCTNSPNLLENFNGALKQSISSISTGYIEPFIVLGSDFRKVVQ